MSLLSTPSTGTWSRLLYLLSHFLVPPPVPSPLPLTLCTLDDDSLLLLFSTLALPPLLTLRRVSRRFAYLIQRYTLPQFRTLLYGYSQRETEDRFFGGRQMLMNLFTSRSVHPYTDFCLDYVNSSGHKSFYGQPRQMHQAVLCTLPASLPRLLPNLSCLTFTCYLNHNSDSHFKLKAECLKVNRLLSGYLQSSWRTTLISLHLYLEVNMMLHPTNTSFPLEPLSQLVALRHLCLQLGPRLRFHSNLLPLLPDSLPVLGQLTSFALHHYSATNVSHLLGQLGPQLECLSLNGVTCSVAQFGAFLGGKPTYRKTLRTLEIHLQVDGPHFQELPVVSQRLPALERLYICLFHNDNLRFRLFNLSRLTGLRELSTLWVTLHQLRALRDNYPREGLPRLSSIRTLDCRIGRPDPVVDFTPEELFSTLLPLLSLTFNRLEHLTINCCLAQTTLGKYSAPLTEQLTTQCKATFHHLLTCKAYYYA